VVVPSMEEFGITAVEAQASGRPVVAAAAGGALETVRERETGLLAKLDDVDSFTDAVRELQRIEFDPQRAVENAARFSVEVFRDKLDRHVKDALGRSDEARTRTTADTP
jgi:glycosyltransferase involved in cell wall biosynthesis